eukprot:scaffold602_cov342-Prasinococcus_capsulatus_cf.AAC.27
MEAHVTHQLLGVLPGEGAAAAAPAPKAPFIGAGEGRCARWPRGLLTSSCQCCAAFAQRTGFRSPRRRQTAQESELSVTLAGPFPTSQQRLSGPSTEGARPEPAQTCVRPCLLTLHP